MKKLFLWAKEKIVEFLKWLWAECKDWHTIVLFVVVALAVSFPIWMGYIIFFIFRWDWALWVATGLWAFWLLPGAPFFTVTLVVTLAIKKIFEKKQEKLQAQERGLEEANAVTAEPVKDGDAALEKEELSDKVGEKDAQKEETDEQKEE